MNKTNVRERKMLIESLEKEIDERLDRGDGIEVINPLAKLLLDERAAYYKELEKQEKAAELGQINIARIWDKAFGGLT